MAFHVASCRSWRSGTRKVTTSSSKAIREKSNLLWHRMFEAERKAEAIAMQNVVARLDEIRRNDIWPNWGKLNGGTCADAGPAA